MKESESALKIEIKTWTRSLSNFLYHLLFDRFMLFFDGRCSDISNHLSVHRLELSQHYKPLRGTFWLIIVTFERTACANHFDRANRKVVKRRWRSDKVELGRERVRWRSKKVVEEIERFEQLWRWRKVEPALGRSENVDENVKGWCNGSRRNQGNGANRKVEGGRRISKNLADGRDRDHGRPRKKLRDCKTELKRWPVWFEFKFIRFSVTSWNHFRGRSLRDWWENTKGLQEGQPVSASFADWRWGRDKVQRSRNERIVQPRKGRSRHRVSRPKWSIFSAKHNYVRQFHALHRMMTVNQLSPFRNRKGLMQNETCSKLGRKNSIKICTSRPDDWPAPCRRFLP
jgi:hypothetical protein